MAPDAAAANAKGILPAPSLYIQNQKKLRVHSSRNKPSLAKTWGWQDELISHRSVNLEVFFPREGPRFEVPLKLLRFCGCGSHLNRSANYLCNTHARLASKTLAFDQKKTLSKANLTNTSKSARVARWCSGTTAAPWTDSLPNTGNCDGQGCTLPLHRSLHKSSKVCQLSPAASGTSAASSCSSRKAELPVGPHSPKYCCIFQTASLPSTGKGATTASLVMCFSLPFPLQALAARCQGTQIVAGIHKDPL